MNRFVGLISFWIVLLQPPGFVAARVFPHELDVGLSVSQDVRTWLDPIVHHTRDLFRYHGSKSTTDVRPLQYSIFHEGRSVLRDIAPPTHWKSKLPSLVRSDKTLLAISMLLRLYCDATPLSLDHRNLDAAHEVLLGVAHDNLSEAEYAATHRGQTSWSKDHPLTDEDDLLHAIIHRLEGHVVGEGEYAGWDNAKYWAAGGPKQNENLGTHPVHQALRLICQQQLAPSAASLLLSDETQSRRHEIIAGGGKTRWVTVERGCWDPIAWIDLCRNLADEKLPTGWTREDIHELQVAELCLLVRWQLIQILKSSESKLWPFSLD